MDWSLHQLFLAQDPDNLSEFECGVNALLPLTVIQSLSSGAEWGVNLCRFASDDRNEDYFWQKLKVRGTQIMHRHS
jgi:hypothetical protein